LLWSGCSFSVRAQPIDAAGDDAPPPRDAIDGPTDGPPADASPCRAVEVSAMSAHTCARMENGDVWCWGINDRGEVGRPVQVASCNSISACNPTPEKLVLPPATRLGVAEEHACAITGNEVYCFGGDAEGQFGDGAGTDTAVPRAVTQRAGASRIGGGLTHGCSLLGAAVYCSGDNANGEVGDASGLPRVTPVVAVPSGAGAIGNGYNQACALESGFAYCWGANQYGQVDTHPGADIGSPRIVPNVAMATAIASGYGHTCAVTAPLGAVRCWGRNLDGELGAGDKSSHDDEVITAINNGIEEVSAGASHTCARTPGGTVQCWGEQYTPTPSIVTLPHPAVSIASGSYHDCFALDDGNVYCLGWNAYGQLGLGTHTNLISVMVSQVNLCP
jgi:alpha-tubulin suppressor-like RCC1 family protein